MNAAIFDMTDWSVYSIDIKGGAAVLGSAGSPPEGRPLPSRKAPDKGTSEPL